MSITSLITGRLIADPERRTGASGKAFTTACLATACAPASSADTAPGPAAAATTALLIFNTPSLGANWQGACSAAQGSTHQHFQPHASRRRPGRRASFLAG